jgi:metacaspase-1
MNQAVISGINIYRDSPENTLRGCVEDAQTFNLLAQNYLGFEPDEITLLLNSHASAARIRTAVSMAVSRAKAGDHILWTHSSHGTNSPDFTQADGLEELLCCYDTKEKDGDWDRATVISAKFIGEMIALLTSGAHMDIFIDCCYAPEGSQLKAMGLSYARTRFLPIPNINMISRKVVIDSKPSKMPPNVCLWSACESPQTSADAYIDGKWQGAFSAAFRKFFKVGRSRSDIIYYARKWLRDNTYQQVPHLYGVELSQKAMA